MTKKTVRLTITGLTAVLMTTSAMAIELPGAKGHESATGKRLEEAKKAGIVEGHSAAATARKELQVNERVTKINTRIGLTPEHTGLQNILNHPESTITYEAKLQNAKGEDIGSQPKTVRLADEVKELMTMAESGKTTQGEAMNEVQTEATNALLKFMASISGVASTDAPGAEAGSTMKLNAEGAKFIRVMKSTIESLGKPAANGEATTVEDVQAYTNLCMTAFSKLNGRSVSLHELYGSLSKEARERNAGCAEAM